MSGSSLICIFGGVAGEIDSLVEVARGGGTDSCGRGGRCVSGGGCEGRLSECGVSITGESMSIASLCNLLA
jgi:hypothetical protein